MKVVSATPVIVPQDLFERVQAKLTKNKKAPARHKAEDDYLLTTKFFCGCCGAYLCGESGTSRTGMVHHYYKCVSVKKKRTERPKKPVRKDWIEENALGLTDVNGKRARDYSGGMKRRLALARALLAPCDAIALDEPFTGMDAENRVAAAECILRAADTKIVLLTTHDAIDLPCKQIIDL